MLPIKMKQMEDPNTFKTTYDKGLDMGKHTFILIITIYLFLTFYLDIAVL